jgi:hypothetical protein
VKSDCTPGSTENISSVFSTVDSHLEHNLDFLEHNQDFLEHNQDFLEHNQDFLEHNLDFWVLGVAAKQELLSVLDLLTILVFELAPLAVVTTVLLRP